MIDISRYESYSILKNSDFSDFYDFCQSKKNCNITTDKLIEKLYDLVKNRIMQVRGERILEGMGTKEIKDAILKEKGLEQERAKEDDEIAHQQPPKANPITINGVQLTKSQCLDLTAVVNSFLRDTEYPHYLGDDEIGMAINKGNNQNLKAILNLMQNKIRD